MRSLSMFQLGSRVQLGSKLGVAIGGDLGKAIQYSIPLGTL
jgi:hypothetical protein